MAFPCARSCSLQVGDLVEQTKSNVAVVIYFACRGGDYLVLPRFDQDPANRINI